MSRMPTLGLLLIAACGACHTLPPPTVVTPSNADVWTIEGGLRIETTKHQWRSRDSIISGVATNETNQDLSEATISYNLLDGKGRTMATARADTIDLLKGGTWEFVAVVQPRLEQYFSTIEIAGVTVTPKYRQPQRKAGSTK